MGCLSSRLKNVYHQDQEKHQQSKQLADANIYEICGKLLFFFYTIKNK